MVGARRWFCRRHGCPQCGARTVFVRYERTRGHSSVAVQARVEVRCTNKDCAGYWR